MKKSIFFLFCGISFCLTLQAQSIGRQVVAAGGTTTVTPAISLSWTVGEAIVGSAGAAGAAGLVLNQGFQQSESAITNTKDPVLQNRLALRVYPNPVVDWLNLDRLSDANSVWQIRLFSAQGLELAFDKGILPAGTTLFSANLSNLPAGQYFLHVQGERPEDTGIVAFQKLK